MSGQNFSPCLGFLACSSGCKSERAVVPYAGIVSRIIKKDRGLIMHLLFSRVTWTPYRALQFGSIRLHFVPTICRDSRHIRMVC